ncbi:MAG: hypothetical protein JWO89_1715 [Verrucomicrobiaceae bacterium]|nr:hypothetical protein [Verrucomicrobiaceae bacterium]
MKRGGIPIYGKVLAWLAVNVLVLALLFFGFLRMQFRMSLDWMLAGPGGDRISLIADMVTRELSALEESEWPKKLRGYEQAYGVTVALFGSDGRQLMGTPLQVPRELVPKLSDKRGLGDRPPPRRPGEGPMNRPPDAPPKPRFMQRAGDPARYWAVIHLDLVQGREQRPLTLAMVSDSITGGGLFFDLNPWVWLGGAGLLLSALVWMPFVRGLTRSIGQLNSAASGIAHGRFSERVPETRNDELGELSCSVNTMAQQLGDYVQQQRRITADVAHELCSPIARMQMALGIVEQRGIPEQASYLKKLDAELQHMAKLVEEVLAFSKAETLPERAAPEDIHLAPLVRQAIVREGSGADIKMDVPEAIHLHTLREALDRALGNVLRNAVRYASHAGPVRIHAQHDADKVCITVSDEGPGVPPDALPRLFEAFYRPEAARARHTGGSGLGLAIVKRCVEACGGTVSAGLRSPAGLEVKLRIPEGLTPHRPAS